MGSGDNSPLPMLGLELVHADDGLAGAEQALVVVRDSLLPGFEPSGLDVSAAAPGAQMGNLILIGELGILNPLQSRPSPRAWPGRWG